ncbi:MAG: RNA-binding S4 domain-containing protein [Acidipropionibacterium acidipropionici]|jgi:ribosome-associated heat shock protein Hsp15|uniref:RNA-binding protein n=2 Tax=Acidipropionibacterium acidipropionici TaxID=1748 RepID=A0AAC9ANW2_9ACTN|nr:RNA-binding S4 domain-containing protein [Acidipropionibacterium acidipropionici]AFV88441.1 S4 domain-containing protein [Acidipropionibacterium acidipropionici ATCC 4875]AMS06190.1 RNA-binding protein [Acidipropionibacterium acidipropionici]AOZ47649.1 RNA-binding protein [Acidipropionibacterium acidipropionici]APZ10045.1 RNA-binding protein [Acidipropionibacterium acidipropionici]AZP39021.1 RNA-binding S4 domain-containing protein [Acidipropionibacterium acidipropionici]
MTRIDVWLWSVRAFKTRSLATNAVKGGHIRLNDDPVKPAKEVKPGDLVTIKTPGWDRVLKVVQPIGRRVGAKIAVEAYEDISAPRPEWLSAPMARRDRGAGRPTKKDRREIERLRGRENR